jgi:nucleoside-diphosphate-sugar epimerase
MPKQPTKASSTSTAPGFTKIPKSCVVTGGSGFVGQRLVEMLVERGCQRVISFDIAPKPKDASSDPKITYIQGDITKIDVVENVCKDVEVVFHIAALVGPYHPTEAYVKVNYEGSLNILNTCKKHGIKRIVMSSSPSTRFPYPDPNVNGLREDELFNVNGGHYAKQFLQPYAETKALGEKAILDACGTKEDDLLTIAVAPHQVYGKRDSLFLPNLLEAGGSGKLRIFGDGKIKVSMCHVDNYCHGLILGYEALYTGSPALGKFYIVTDDGYAYFWKIIDEAIIGMGFNSIWKKMKLPTWLMMIVAYICVFIGNLFALLTGTPKHRVNYYLKLNPFSVKMLVINRYFDISNAKKDLKYEPLISFDQGWKETIEWFKVNWLPKYKKDHNQS